MLKTLIVGGAGFLGSHICDRLIAEGHQVICVDNLLTGKKENITHLLENESFTFVNHDITKPLEIETNLNYILHFASPASPKDYIKFPIETMMVGALGTYNLLELARNKNAVFLLASTSEVYGDPEVNPQPEDYWGHVNPIGPRSVYDEAKRYAEALTMAYRRKYGLDVRIARIFNTYGPRMKVDDGRLISNFIVQAVKGAPITVYGDGSQTRSFCYVDDLVEGIYHLTTHESLYGTVINLGNCEEVTILDLAHLIKELTESTVVYCFSSFT
jgi:dTDP-glucose 4,6-dehydratase